jgi:glycerophosphoryl diester phosphodiesterase
MTDAAAMTVAPVTARPKGVMLDGPNGTIRLKWHRLRRRAGDIDFTAQRLRHGLASGASMEIDLRRHAGNGFVCLHDAVLESETTGVGPIAAATVADLRRLRMRGPDGTISPEPLLLFDDLIAIAEDGGHPDAVVQFDLKEYSADLDDRLAASFASLVAPNAHRFILSGDDWDAVRRLGGLVPGLKLGFDPCELPQAQGLKTARDFADLTLFTLQTAAEAQVIYLQYHLVLAALDAGFDIVAALHGGGRMIDAWTLDVTAPDADESLIRLIRCGVDQISSNDCVAIEDAARRLGVIGQPAR